mgnify:CR=1 FL=1
MADPLISLQDLSVSFPTDDGVVDAVRGVSLDVFPSEVVAIVGESGSGKSVTALAIMRLHPKTAQQRGRIVFDGTDILALSEKQMRQVRGNSIAMIFQDPMTALNPVFTVGDQLAEMIVTHQPVKKDKAYTSAEDLLAKVGVAGRRDSWVRCADAASGCNILAMPKSSSRTRPFLSTNTLLGFMSR